MIEAIYISIGKIHRNVPKLIWDNMANEMRQKFNCDGILNGDEAEDTTMRMDGDLSFDEMFEPQEIFSNYMEPMHLFFNGVWRALHAHNAIKIIIISLEYSRLFCVYAKI
ncbi:hypothetical protein [Acinetobacter baumannii]|uniref:hypothetical protein n=1 Tax=Acinetobacter baumannii TaxID=470 RepID=UPI00098D6462|nr:hypothetical protein [Acinetobacter baumannii]OOM98382.1 hypothetical protein A4W99_19670 [Acinetobacter baumannii]